MNYCTYHPNFFLLWKIWWSSRLHTQSNPIPNTIFPWTVQSFGFNNHLSSHLHTFCINLASLSALSNPNLYTQCSYSLGTWTISVWRMYRFKIFSPKLAQRLYEKNRVIADFGYRHKLCITSINISFKRQDFYARVRAC